MRRFGQMLAVVGLLAAINFCARAGDADVTTIINKAIKAHLPKGVDTKNQGFRTKTKGTLHVMGVDLDFTQEISMQKGKFKEVMELDVMGNKISVTSVYNGKDAWIRRGDADVPVNDDILNEFKDAAYMMSLMQGVFTKDKTVKYSIIGEAKVKGKDAVGVNISRQGKKDISIYFDKGSGLMSKVELRRKDLQSGQEISEERFILEYKETNGNKTAKRVEVLRDGKAFLEAEVTDYQAVEKIDDSEFAQPK